MDHPLDFLYLKVVERWSVFIGGRTLEAPGPIKEDRTTPPDYYQEGKKSHGASDDRSVTLTDKPRFFQLDLLSDRLGNLEAVNPRATNEITTRWAP